MLSEGGFLPNRGGTTTTEGGITLFRLHDNGFKRICSDQRRLQILCYVGSLALGGIFETDGGGMCPVFPPVGSAPPSETIPIQK